MNADHIDAIKSAGLLAIEKAMIAGLNLAVEIIEENPEMPIKEILHSLKKVIAREKLKII